MNASSAARQATGSSNYVADGASGLPLAFVGTYPPRRCGIATFTRDLADAVSGANGHAVPMILALTDPAGDTAATMRECGANAIANLGDARDIEIRLEELLPQLRSRTAQGVAPDVAAAYSRRAQTGNLAGLFDRVIARHAPPQAAARD